MQVMEVMSRKVATVDADANLGQAAAEMQDKNVGILPVLDGDSVAGVVTDRDLVVRGIAQHLDPESTKVRDVMSTDPVIVHMDAPVEQAAEPAVEAAVGPGSASGGLLSAVMPVCVGLRRRPSCRFGE